MVEVATGPSDSATHEKVQHLTVRALPESGGCGNPKWERGSCLRQTLVSL